MRLLKSLSLMALLASCSSTPVMEKALQEKFMSDFEDTNRVIANRYFRNFQQYEGFTLTYWEMILEQLSTDRALTLKKELRSFDIIRARGFEKGIVVCAYSNYFQIGFCDNTRCEGVELSGFKSENDVAESMARALTYTCSK